MAGSIPVRQTAWAASTFDPCSCCIQHLRSDPCSIPAPARQVAGSPAGLWTLFNRQIRYIDLTILLWLDGCPATAAEVLRIIVHA